MTEYRLLGALVLVVVGIAAAMIALSFGIDVALRLLESWP